MSDSGFRIYLSFKNKATAEKWLAEHGIAAEFPRSQVINVRVIDNAIRQSENARLELGDSAEV